MKYDCVGLGVNAVDYLCVLDPYPHLDDKVEAVTSSVQGGGPVPTAMVTLAKFGAKVCYIGKVGDDTEGQFVKSQLEKEEVDTQYLLTDKKIKTDRAFIWVDKRSGKRTVVLDRDKKNRFKKDELKFLNSISTRFLHIDAREPEINILVARWAKKTKCPSFSGCGQFEKRGGESISLCGSSDRIEKICLWFCRNARPFCSMSGIDEKRIQNCGGYHR